MRRKPWTMKPKRQAVRVYIGKDVQGIEAVVTGGSWSFATKGDYKPFDKPQLMYTAVLIEVSPLAALSLFGGHPNPKVN